MADFCYISPADIITDINSRYEYIAYFSPRGYISGKPPAAATWIVRGDESQRRLRRG